MNNYFSKEFTGTIHIKNGSHILNTGKNFVNMIPITIPAKNERSEKDLLEESARIAINEIQGKANTWGLNLINNVEKDDFEIVFKTTF